jgi:hypothetical protein
MMMQLQWRRVISQCNNDATNIVVGGEVMVPYDVLMGIGHKRGESKEKYHTKSRAPMSQ